MIAGLFQQHAPMEQCVRAGDDSADGVGREAVAHGCRELRDALVIAGHEAPALGGDFPVEPAEKLDRQERLMELQSEISQAKLAAKRGQQLEVLVDSVAGTRAEAVIFIISTGAAAITWLIFHTPQAFVPRCIHRLSGT